MPPKSKDRWPTHANHTLISPDGVVPASIVTDKDTGDSPMFAKLCAKIPERSGPAPGDSAYCSSDNCEAAITKGRDPYFEPKKNNAGKGTSNWAKMVRL